MLHLLLWGFLNAILLEINFLRLTCHIYLKKKVGHSTTCQLSQAMY